MLKNARMEETVSWLKFIWNIMLPYFIPIHVTVHLGKECKVAEAVRFFFFPCPCHENMLSLSVSQHYLLSASHTALCLWFTQITANALYICEEVNDIRLSIHVDRKSVALGGGEGYYISKAVKSVVPPGWFCQLYLRLVKPMMPWMLLQFWKVNGTAMKLHHAAHIYFLGYILLWNKNGSFFFLSFFF